MKKSDIELSFIQKKDLAGGHQLSKAEELLDNFETEY